MTKEQEMTPCPDTRTITRWARNGPEKIDAAIFQHLLHCDKCRNRWQFELEYRLYKKFADEYIPTEEDIKSVKEFLVKKQEEEERWSSLMDKLGLRHEVSGMRHAEPDPRHAESGMRHEVSDLCREEPGMRHEESGTRHAEPDPRHEESGSCHEESGSCHEESGMRHDEPDPRHEESGIRHEVSDPRREEPGMRHEESGSCHEVSGTRHEESDPRHEESGTRHEVSVLCHEADGIAGTGLPGSDVADIFACFAVPPAMVAGGNNVNEQLYSSGGGEQMIVFIASCPEDDPRYWKAELALPFEKTLETILSLYITDGKGSPLESGKFVLFDQELKIEGGVAEITFAQFIMNMKKHSVKLVFDDEEESKGTLRFF